MGIEGLGAFFEDLDDEDKQQFRELQGTQGSINTKPVEPFEPDAVFSEDDLIVRADKYNISIGGIIVRATEEQELRIRGLTPSQLQGFRRIMGG